MARGAGAAFFLVKKEWSKRKDRLLVEYLPKYLPKVAHALRRPVLVVDGFAGPGKFGDGEPGSPLLIAQAMQKAAAAQPPLPAALSACFVEKDPSLCAQLRENTKPYGFVKVLEGKFIDNLPAIEQDAKGKTLFMYLDPFTVEGLEWDALARVFRLVKEIGKSVEVLVNFNAASFARRGLGALKQQIPAPDPAEEDTEDVDPIDPSSLPSIAHLDSMVGGDWWQAILRGSATFAEKVNAIRDGFSSLLKGHFNEVCVQDVRSHWRHKVPKYSLIFASRIPVALLLMNDAMVESREMEVGETAAEATGVLIDNRKSVAPSDEELLVRLRASVGTDYITREEAICRVVRTQIGAWTAPHIREQITALLKSKEFQSETDEVRINDKKRIRRRPPA